MLSFQVGYKLLKDGCFNWGMPKFRTREDLSDMTPKGGEGRGREWENQVRDGLGEVDLSAEIGLSGASRLASALHPRDMGRTGVVHANVGVKESDLPCGVGQYEREFWQQDYFVAPVKQCSPDRKPVRLWEQGSLWRNLGRVGRKP